jgi:hypothetical protein
LFYIGYAKIKPDLLFPNRVKESFWTEALSPGFVIKGFGAATGFEKISAAFVKELSFFEGGFLKGFVC